ncbi:Tif3p Ecym_7208 [Eremothecium cymbalariae DBVPG|uniref:RRM domain-containing protein n=1 Tax=Eremothecium cymbalariae (strain CBS 270.75 / DBVPG 7215 / KCTC 17166 / NRRL Y-17582) TaxID=931890 RepID=G8JW41_ERECY|nr:hypothetical protein Ecym_7208 [Eremothecium cymbalariae DBVPG\
MVPPKKNAIKMDLNSFLNDESFGDSWADDQVDLNNINLPIHNVAASNTIPLDQLANGTMGGGKGSYYDSALTQRKERIEYPVPNEGPFRARISNLPWDVSEEGIHAWTEDGLDKPGSVLKVVAPKDRDSERLRGWAFVTFEEREDLVKALTLNATKLNDRTVYVAVAAPKDGSLDDMNWSGARGSNFQSSGSSNPDLDWGAARGSNFKERKPRREDPDLDWGGARGSNYESKERRTPREEPDLDWGVARGSNYELKERRPPREEPDLDWGGARGSNYESKERRPPREEPNLDWGVARGSNYEPKERRPKREEPNLDWGSAKGSLFQTMEKNPRKEELQSGRSASKSSTQDARERRPKKDEPDLNWSAARSSKVALSANSTRKAEHYSAAKDDTPKIQRSAFDVLKVDSDDDDDDDEQEEQNTPERVSNSKPANNDSIAQLEDATSKLSIEQDSEWEVVGKK